MNLSDNVKIVKVLAATVAGTSAVNGSAVDMQGFDGVLFIAHLGALTATQVTKLQAQGSSDNDSDYAAFATDAVTPAAADADSDKLLVLDIFRPVTRYVRPTVERATANAVVDGVIAILYRADFMPVTADGTVSQGAKFVSP